MMAMAAPSPKSPPASPDPRGRHRLQLAVDKLHREIGFLEGEINSIEGIYPASRCCKEVDEFIGRNPDPFIKISEKGNTDQSHHFSKKFRAKTCLSYLAWICCCGGCSYFQLKKSSCCSCAALERPCRCCGGCFCCRCRASCCCTSSPCRTPCPRCSCGCTCSCPSCSCTCPSCSTGCCLPRCCRCL